jgi:cobalt-zinc-cadmium efflux system membrane fusion protein
LQPAIQKMKSPEATIVANENPSIVTLTAEQLRLADLQLDKIGQRDIATILKVNGKIDVPPQNMVSISTALGGYLKYTKLLPGMHVKKGEVIAKIEDQQFVQLQQDYLSTTSKLRFAELEYNRQKDLNETKATSDKQFQQVESEYRSLQIEQSGLTQKLHLLSIDPGSISISTISKTINIYSPIDGFVTHVNVNIGKYIAPSEVLFELVNPTDIHLNLKVFEKDIAKLKIGQKLVCFTNTEPNKKHACEIILISKDISPEHTAEVHCHFENYEKDLLPGMYMNAEIALQIQNSNTLPEDAIVTFENKDYIFVALDSNRFEMTEVQTGVYENGFYEIKNIAALEGKSIAIQNSYTLLMALKNKEEE